MDKLTGKDNDQQLAYVDRVLVRDNPHLALCKVPIGADLVMGVLVLMFALDLSKAKYNFGKFWFHEVYGITLPSWEVRNKYLCFLLIKNK